MVEWVYAKVLKSEAWEEEWRKFDRHTREGIFAVAHEALPKLRAFAEAATDAQLEKRYSITRAPVKVSAAADASFSRTSRFTAPGIGRKWRC
jgi:hypothetical protein